MTGTTLLHAQTDTMSILRLRISDTLTKNGLSMPTWHNPCTMATIGTDAEKTLSYLENHGFPFAEVKVYRIREANQEILEARVIANQIIFWDSIVNVGDVRLSPRFLHPYLKIRRGTPYREEAVKYAEEALRSLPYIEILRPPSPTFTDRAAALYIYLGKKPANQFDGFIGFSPDETGKGMTVYGQLQLKMANMFARGESVSVDWRRPRPENQQLLVDGVLPCLSGTPVGLGATFDMLKNDSSLHRISIPAGLRYQLKGGNSLQAYYRYERCHSTVTTSPHEDYRCDMYGIRASAGRADDARIPHKGYRLDFTGETGRKTESGSGERSTVARGHCTAECFLPMGRRWVQYFRLQGGMLLDREAGIGNMFRLGGLRSLRGMDEESVSASSYSILTAEIRFFLDRNIFLQAFADGGWYERKGNAPYRNDHPAGCGFGLTFDSRAGLLSLNYAVAAHDGQGFRLRSAKVSVGYSAVF